MHEEKSHKPMYHDDLIVICEYKITYLLIKEAKKAKMEKFDVWPQKNKPTLRMPKSSP
jgi:hypothetical protein